MTTTSMNASIAKDELPDLINRVIHHKERFILTRRDNPVAALIPIEDFHLLQSIQSKSDLQEALDALKEARSQGSISLDELSKKVD